jgi:hypothetical protein
MHHLLSEEALLVNIVAFLFSVPPTLARVFAGTNRQGRALEGCRLRLGMLCFSEVGPFSLLSRIGPLRIGMEPI